MESPSPDTSPKPKRAVWRGLVLGVLVLGATWLAALLLEPYLRLAAASSADPAALRASAGSWANSSAWLLAQSLALICCLAAGFVSKRWSPAGSWVAFSVVLLVALLYVVFAQFPATRSPWRIGLWAVGVPLALLLGAAISARRRSAV
jgi:hypothetical protein